MIKESNIVQRLRVVLMAITLLCVVGLNNREVTTYVAIPEAPAKHRVNQTSAENHSTVKQKVSFEGTYSYLVLQLAACPEFLNIVFTKPFCYNFAVQPISGTLIPFFSRFLSSVIQPNAP